MHWYVLLVDQGHLPVDLQARRGAGPAADGATDQGQVWQGAVTPAQDLVLLRSGLVVSRANGVES